jgi:hypothetical protein
MLLEARTVAGEGVTLTAEMMADVEAGGLEDCAAPPAEFDVLPLEPAGTCVESAAPVEVLGAALVAPPHPQPPSVKVMRIMTNRKNCDLLGGK